MGKVETFSRLGSLMAMENDYEMSSSSLTFASLPDPGLEAANNNSNADYLSLSKLSSSLEKLLLNPGSSYTDAEIVVDGVPVGVHRCLLAARSEYFHGLFSKPCDGSDKKPRYLMSELMAPVRGYVGLEAFNVILNYLYTGRMKQSPPEVSTCVDDQCVHESCRPAIDYVVELMYASTTFQIEEPLRLFQRRLLQLVDKALVEDVIPILNAASRCNMKPLLSHCILRVAASDLDRVVLEKEIPPEVLPEIKLLQSGPNQDAAGPALPQSDPTDHEKRIRSIHKALDSDDVELLELLLSEAKITLNEAFALHYAAAYSDPKIFKKVLYLKLADLNLKNPRGLTVLHVAARRKEPSILVALIENRANVFETTSDGQTALRICRRLTRPKDYNEKIQKGRESNKDKMCIDLLERQMKDASVSRSTPSVVTADDLHRLDYLESRVKMAGMLFPSQAMIAMEIAGADWTPLYKGLASKGSPATVKDVGSNETMSMSVERLHQKLQALRKTVEIGKRYFPNCSEEIVKFVDDMPEDEALYLEKGSEDEKKKKKMRLMELREDIQRAFDKDIAENKGPTSFPSLSPSASSSSSSSPRGRMRSNKTRIKS